MADHSMYPESYRGAQRYRDRYDGFTPQQQHEAWAQSGQPMPVSPESVYQQPAAPVDQPIQAQIPEQQFQIPANPYPAMSQAHRQFREMEVMGDTSGIQNLLQQMPPQATGLFGM